MDDILLEPLKAYTDVYEQNFEQNAKAYLDELVKSSGVDEALNRQTVERYTVAAKKNADHCSRLSRLKGLNVFCIVFAVIMAIAALIAAFSISGSSIVPILVLICGILIAVGLILISFLVMKPKIKLAAADAEASAKEAEKIKAEAWQQMVPLNSMFEDTATKQLIEKTVPLLQIDDNFDMRRYDYLRGKYGLGENDDKDSSTIEILSGEILGNPFVVDRELVHRYGTETYHGSLVITWTTSYTDSKGNHHTQTHTQTLHASVEKPKPFYSERTRLIYGNEAAPDLHFTHTPSHAERYTEQQAEKRVRSGAKKIQKRQERAIKDGSSFTEMANEAFDVFFGALDRDHEVQFRLLFTPLAQKNMLELMRSTRGFGDDFNFRKSGCLNYISSEHSASWDMNTAYSRYASYDLNQIRNNFLSFNRAYFRSLYFDLAPLLSIPLYQQHKPKEYIYEGTYGRNYTDYEAECAVNALGERSFAHPHAATPAILKTQFLHKEGESDSLEVEAYSYKTVEHVEYVSVFGGDGFMHAVPVPWTEYIPVQKTSRVMLKKVGMSDSKFLAASSKNEVASTLRGYGIYHYYRGMLCCLLNANGGKFDEDVSAAFKQKN